MKNDNILKIIAAGFVTIAVLMGAALVYTYMHTYTKQIISAETIPTAAGVVTTENISTEQVSEETVTNEPVNLDMNLRFNFNRYNMYTYVDMENDLNLLKEHFADKAQLNVLTQTADGRNLYDMVVGNQSSANQYIVTGSIHAREYITTKLVMLLLYDYLEAGDVGKDVLIHFIPMINPDGVSISQLGMGGIRTDAVRQKVNEIASLDGRSVTDSSYLQQWKANANGVDLNRNFDALWDSYEGASHVSSDHYKGTAPGCEKESAALIALTQSNPIKKTISYHTMGEVVYWYFGQTGALRTQTEAFAQRIGNSTGYQLDANYQNLDPAGYKDWALSTLSIPSITIEVGTGNNPVSESQIDNIYEENKHVIDILIG